MKWILAVALLFLFLACSSETTRHATGSKHLDRLFSQADVPPESYSIVRLKQKGVGWNDTFMSGILTLHDINGLSNLVAKSSEVRSNSYAPLEKGSLDQLEKSGKLATLKLYRPSKRFMFYYVLIDDQVIFDFLVV